MGHCSHWSWGDVAFFPAAGSELGCVPRVEQVPLFPGSHLSPRSQLPHAGPYERVFSGFVWLLRLLASVYLFSWKEPLNRIMTTADLSTTVFSCVAWSQAAPNLSSGPVSSNRRSAWLSKEKSRERVMHGPDRKGKQIPRDRVVVQITFTPFATGC